MSTISFPRDLMVDIHCPRRSAFPGPINSAYAVWFTGPGDKARRLGFTNPVGEDGTLGIQGPSEKDVADFPKLYATHANVVVSQESSEDAERPTRMLPTGKLPQGR